MKRRTILSGVAAGLLAGSLAFVLVSGGGSQAEPSTQARAPSSTSTSTSTPTQTGSSPSTRTSDPTTSRPPETTTTTAAPTTTTTLGTLVIQGTGDVNFDPDYITAFRDVGYAAAFDGLDDIFLTDSVTVINLECPPTEVGVAAQKEFSFRCDPASLPVAAERGVEVANLANNHGQDRGVDGLLDAIEKVEAAGIQPVGVGPNVEEAMHPALLDVEGWTVAVVGMGGVVPSDGWLATDDRAGMASGDDIDAMTRQVAAAEEMADVVVVTIHWGRELIAEPDAEDRQRAEAMIAAGADVIFGHHPHRLGELEVVEGVPVFWTLGNFIWPRLSDAGATSAIGRVVITPSGDVTACLVPVFIERDGRPELRGDPPC